MDRGYAKFALFNKIGSSHRSYVCRIRDNSNHDVREQRELSDAEKAAGKDRQSPDHTVRLVCVKCSPHTSRSKNPSKSKASNGVPNTIGPDPFDSLKLEFAAHSFPCIRKIHSRA